MKFILKHWLVHCGNGFPPASNFKPRSGEHLAWTNTAGGKGVVTVDPFGLVTIESLKIKPAETTVLTISKLTK